MSTQTQTEKNDFVSDIKSEYEYDPTRGYALQINEDFSKNFLEYVIKTLKMDHLLDLDSKLSFTHHFISYRHLLTDFVDFFDEECHLTLLNWIYRKSNDFKSNNGVDEKFFHLLYNIIIIFQIVPIKVADLLELKIFEKFNKIRKYIQKSSIIYQQLSRLIEHWTEFCSENYVFEQRRNVGRKRARDEIFEEDLKKNFYESSEINTDDDFSLSESESITSCDSYQKDLLKFNKSKNKSKSVIWDKELTKIKIFDKEQPPAHIRLSNKLDAEDKEFKASEFSHEISIV